MNEDFLTFDLQLKLQTKMPIKSSCPKCGKIGTQTITHYPNKTNSKYNYLGIIHNKKKRCYIGRIRTTDESMNELNKPEPNEEYEKILSNLAIDFRRLSDHYSPNTAISIKTISKKVDIILRKYNI